MKRGNDGTSSSSQSQAQTKKQKNIIWQAGNNLQINMNHHQQVKTHNQNMNPKDGKPKPIFINEHVSKVKTVIKGVTLEKTPEIHFRVVNGTPRSRITPLTSSDKRTLLDLLKAQSITYHTFTESADKLPVFVLKHHYREDLAEMLALLKKATIPASSVNFIVDSENPIYVVKFSDSSINLMKLNTTFKSIDSVYVKWEALKQSKKRFTQCFNCQRPGHSSINCGYQYRCVACGSSEHGPKQCPRKAAVPEMEVDGVTPKPKEKPKCCNCGGEHTANFRQCIVYKDYVNNIKQSRKNTKKVNQHPQFNVSDYNNEFPELLEVPVTPVFAPAGGQTSKISAARANLKNIVNPPKTGLSGTHTANINAQRSFSESLKNSGESRNRLQQNGNAQCQQCGFLLDKVSQLQEQIFTLTNQLANFMSANFFHQPWV